MTSCTLSASDAIAVPGIRSHGKNTSRPTAVCTSERGPEK